MMSASSSLQRNKDSSSSLLDQVLPKLRPFQREALEFAVQGARYQRQCSLSTAEKPDQQNRDDDASWKVQLSTHRDKLLGKGRILLADEMGLGKTVTSLAIMAFYESDWPLLILCPASLKKVWPNEIEIFFPSLTPHIYVCQGFADTGWQKRKDVKVVVVTYSLLQKRSAVCHAICCANSPFQAVIADESHSLKQKNSQRSQFILPVLRRAKRLLLLSGTPALARPVELWTQLSCLAPRLFGNWTTFTNHYCNPKRKFVGRGQWGGAMDYSGSSNEAELYAKLQLVMVRRLKSHVLSELPPKQRSIVPIDIPAAHVKACKEAMAAIGDAKKNNVLESELSGKQQDFEARSKIMRAYQQSGVGKAPAVADYLMDWLEGSSSKILVFAHHQGVLDTIEQALLSKKTSLRLQHIRIDGSVSTAVRSQRVRQFQTCAGVRVALLSITAAGVGLTLTAASTVLFAELHWTPGVLAQAEDRAHRIGQVHDSVNIQYLVCKDTSKSLDMTLWNMLGKKMHTLDQVVDGRAKEDRPQLLDAAEEKQHAPTGKSVQEELTEFFADAATSEKKNKTPVKGTIESFFRKIGATNKKKTPVSGQRKMLPASLAGSKGMSSGAKSRTTIPANSLPHSKAQASSTRAKEQLNNFPDLGTWECGVCTFVNKTPRKKVLPCEMCGSLSKNTSSDQANKGTAKTSVPSSSFERKTSWTCKLCTYENEKPSSASGWYQCLMCEESHFPDDGDSSDPELENDWKTPRAESTTTSSQRPTRVSTASEIDLTSSAVPTFSQSQEVIELDDESSDESAVELKPTTSSRIEKHGGKGTEMIVLDCDDEDESVDATEALPLEDSGLDERLMFSVSKNTGRITIHFPANGGPSPVNFEVEQVVSGETVDILLNARIERASGPRPPLQVEFNQRRIQLLLDRLHNVGGFFDERRDVYAQEIKEFVSNCLKLREAEKKALKDSGRAFPAAGLSQAVAGLMSRAVYSTERYTGGAKERAREREKDGTSTETDRAVLAGEACAMCGKRLSAACTAAGSAYCSQDCAEEGRLCRGGMYASSKIRAAVFALEGGKCTLCGIDAHSLFEQIRALEPARRLNKLLAVNWRLPTSSKALQNLLQDPKEHHFWQADHIRAVAEGGGGCGVENLRTLCVPCHAQETEKLRGRLPLHKPFESDSGNKRKQTDIRSAFSVAAKRARND